MSYIVATEAEAEVRIFLPVVNQGRSVDGDTRIGEIAFDEMAAGIALPFRSIFRSLVSAVVKTNVCVGEGHWVAILVRAVAGGYLDEPEEGAAVFHLRIAALLVQGHVQLGKVTFRFIVTVIPIVFWVTHVSIVIVVVELHTPTGGLVYGREVVVLHVPLVPNQAHQLQLPSLAEAQKEQEKERTEKFCLPHCRTGTEASASPQASPLLLSSSAHAEFRCDVYIDQLDCVSFINFYLVARHFFPVRRCPGGLVIHSKVHQTSSSENFLKDT